MPDQQTPPVQPDTGMSALIKAVTDAGSPALASMLGGPGASVGLAALGRTLLGDAEAVSADILAALQQGGTDVQLAVQEAQQSILAQLSVADAPFDFTAFFPAARTMTAADGANTESARSMQIKLHDKVNQRLAYAVTAGFFVLIILIIFYPYFFANSQDAVDQGVRNLLFTLLGVVATGWSNIIGFYFGSSAGSEQKSQTLSAALDQANAKKP
jgi:hypothetical protein